MQFPQDLRYTKEHEWARRQSHLVRVAITHFALDALGDVGYGDLPDVGAKVVCEERHVMHKNDPDQGPP